MSHRRLPVKVTPTARPKRPRVTVATVHDGLAWRIGGFLKHPVVGLCLGVFATALFYWRSVPRCGPASRCEKRKRSQVAKLECQACRCFSEAKKWK